MSPSIIILCLVFTTRLSFAINFGYTPQPQPPKVLDDAGDFKPPRDITEEWFKYVNSSSMFQDDPKWGDRDWTPFIESFGIWALFYRTGPPVANYPPPSFSHIETGGAAYTYIIVKCYIEGSSYIDVHVNEDVTVGRITKEIISGFQETRIFFTEPGSYNFNITLHLNSPDDVILFDSITAGNDIPMPTTTPVPKFCLEDVVLDKDTDTDIGWTVKGQSTFLEYFKEISDLKTWWSTFASDYNFPTNFNFTPFEGVHGIWLVYNYNERLFDFDIDFQMNDSLPFFKFFPSDEGAHYDSADVRCYLHGTTTLVGDFESEHDNDTLVEVPSLAPHGWDNVTLSFPGEGGVRNFSIQVNLEVGSFGFIDQMVAIRSSWESDCRETNTTTKSDGDQETSSTTTETTTTKPGGTPPTTENPNGGGRLTPESCFHLLIIQLSFAFVYFLFII